MNDAQKLMSLKSDLERHESIKNSCVQGPDWGEKKKKLESEFFNLRISLFEKQITDLQTAKQRLEKEFKEGKKTW
jgi:hypothetical protein